MAKIFISYDMAQDAFAQEFKQQITNLGHRVVGFLGERTVGDFDAQIIQDLGESDVAVFLLTKEACKYDWLISEVGAAKAFHSEHGKPGILPLIFPEGDVPKSMPKTITRHELNNCDPRAAALTAHAAIQKMPLPTSRTLPQDKLGTLKWLFENLSIGVWCSIAAAAAVLFIWGIYMGQIDWVKRLAKVPVQEISQPARH